MPRRGLDRVVAGLPALSLLFCPYPPDPLPSGKGENHSFLMQGAKPLASPGLGGKRHWRWARRQCSIGGLAPGDADAAGGDRMPGGGLTGWLPVYPAFTILPAPIPPTPFPSGEGGDHKLVLPGGFAPGTPAAVPVRRWRWEGRWRPAGGLAPGGADAAGGGGMPGGGLTGRLPVYLAFSLLCCPYPPDPLPSGKGENHSFLMQGASPLASPGLGGKRHRRWVEGSVR